MTIHETKIGLNGEVISDRQVPVGGKIDLGEIPPGTLDITIPQLGLGLKVSTPPFRRIVRVLPPDSREGRDRVSLEPMGGVLIGNQINRANLVFSSKEPGVQEVRITSTRNPRRRPKGKSRRS